MLSDILSQVQAIYLRSDDGACNHMRWGGSSFGQFTVKSAYLRDTPSVLEYQDKIWRAFWQIKVPQRCMVFLCMVFRGRIMTNELRASFDLTSNSYCSLCNEGWNLLCMCYVIVSRLGKLGMRSLIRMRVAASIKLLRLIGLRRTFLSHCMMGFRRHGIGVLVPRYGGCGNSAIGVFSMRFIFLSKDV